MTTSKAMSDSNHVYPIQFEDRKKHTSHYKLFLPQAETDYIQRELATKGKPYEYDMLKQILGYLTSNSLFVDIGANIGNHSILAAIHTKCQVLAFEPNIELWFSIKKSIEINDVPKDRFIALNLALGDEDGFASFKTSIPHNMGEQALEKGEGEIRVVTLDSMSLPDCDKILLKIDVEGMEMDVLRGAQHYISTRKPIITVEALTLKAFDEINNYLSNFGYVVQKTFNASPTHLYLHRSYINPTLYKDLIREHAYVFPQRVKELKQEIHNHKSAKLTAPSSVTVSKTENKNKIVSDKEHNDLKEQLAKERQLLMTLEIECLRNKSLIRRLEYENRELKSQSFRNRLDASKIKRDVSSIYKDFDSVKMKADRLRSTLSFQLGEALINASRSFYDFYRLPGRLIDIKRQSELRKKDLNKIPTDDDSLKLLDKGLPIVDFERSVIEAPQRTFKHTDVITTLTNSAASVSEKRNALKSIKIAAIMDDFTFGSYSLECQVLNLSLNQWQSEIDAFKPDILFVESAWRGRNEEWGSRVGHTATEVVELIAYCKSKNIATCFWNKEDPVHFETFLNTAQLVDFIFTTDIDCVPRYKKALEHDNVYYLPFAAQTKTHNPIEHYDRKDAFCFAGAYYVKYPERTKDLESFVLNLGEYKPFEIYDRNFGKDDVNYMFPEEYQPYIVGTLPFSEIHRAYKGYKYAINLNSVKQSQSMFARRAYELLACNTVTISNYSRGVHNLFGDLILTSDSGQQIVKQLECIEEEPMGLDRHRLKGLRKVLQYHTYENRLAFLVEKMFSLDEPLNLLPEFTIFTFLDSQSDVDCFIEMLQTHSYRSFKCFIIVPDESLIVSDEKHIEILHQKQITDVRFTNIVDSDSWVCFMHPNDYYGPNYLLDFALTTKYATHSAICKGASFEVNGEHGLYQDYRIPTYHEVHEAMSYRNTVIAAYIIEEQQVLDTLDSFKQDRLFQMKALSIDCFNYCRDFNLLTEKEKEKALALFTDKTDTNEGFDFNELQQAIQSVPLEKGSSDDAISSMQSELLFSLFPAENRQSGVCVEHSVEGLNFNSSLPDGKHDYVYTSRDLDFNELNINNGQFKGFLKTTLGLNLQLTLIFFTDAKERLKHYVVPANKNITIEVPQNASKVRLGIRVYAGGEAAIQALYLDNICITPDVVFTKGTDTLILTNHYPSYDDIYRNGFIHSRVKGYMKHDRHVDIFRLRSNAPLSFHEFEGVQCLTGSGETLQRLLAQGNHTKVLVHFLDAEMWKFLEPYADKIDINVWIHGAEIQPFHRRSYNYVDSDEATITKVKAQFEERESFWKSILKCVPQRMTLVFVSNYFAKEVMDDYDVQLDKQDYRVIHNSVDTGLFKYHKKLSEHRTHIVSIRPYASLKYGNDLSVNAVLKLVNEPFFSELKFLFVGDGPMFEDTLAPLREFENVTIDRRFMVHEDIATLYESYGICLVPTRWDSQGVSRDEAMAAGLVPITSNNSAIPEFLDTNTGFIVDTEDTQGLANAIKELYYDPEKFLCMSREASIRVNNTLNVDKIIHQEINLIWKKEQ